MKQIFFAALALFVGALIPIQAATNAAMAKVVGDFSIAALALFLIGLATVSGWIIAAVIIDHFGLFGANLTVLNWQRGTGIALMIVGLFLAKR